MLSLHGATPKWIKVPERRLSMVTFTIVSVLVGALLGMRFRVFILLPVVLLTVAIVAAVGLARDLLEIVVVMTALELGVPRRKRGGPNLVGVTQVSGCPWRGPVQWPSSSN
jgi:hypothetical protein